MMMMMMMMNSGKTKTTGIAAISRLPYAHVWWNSAREHLS